MNLRIFRASKNQVDFLLYANLSLLSLFDCIVSCSDPMALEEFHTRPLFFAKGAVRLCCVEYLNWLREIAERSFISYQNAVEVAEMAYGLTLDKFSSLPDTINKEDQKMKHGGSDCRLYL